MNFSAWSIRNPVPAILLFILLTAGGLLAFDRLAVQNFPDMDLPTIQVRANLEGAAPAQLETEVARKIEDRLASLSSLDHITTTITDGTVRERPRLESLWRQHPRCSHDQVNVPAPIVSATAITSSIRPLRRASSAVLPSSSGCS